MTYRLPQVLTEFSFGIGMVNTEKIPKCSYQNTESVYNSSSPAHYQNQECEIRRKDLEIPPQDVDCWNSSSRSDSRGYFVRDIFSCLGLWCLVHLSTSTLTTDFICSPRSDSDLLLTNAKANHLARTKLHQSFVK